MKYSELEDKAIRAIASYDDRIEKGTPFQFYRDPNTKTGRDVLQNFIDKGHIDQHSLVGSAVYEAEQVESKIRQLHSQNLPGSKIKQARKALESQLIKKIESIKRNERKKLLEKLDQIRKQGSKKSTQEELLQLKKYELKYKNADPAKVQGRLPEFERSGYDPNELLVIGSINEDLYQRTQAVRETIPPEYAHSKDAVGSIHRLAELNSLKAGEVSYKMNGVVNRLFVGNLIDENALQPNYDAFIDQVIKS